MTAAERAREEGRRAGLLEAVKVIEGVTLSDPAEPPERRLQWAASPKEVLRRLRSASGPAQVGLDGGEEPAAAGAQEIAARALIVLQAHLQAREKFFKEERGAHQPPTAAAQEEALKEIRAALVRHHETNGEREKWRKTSAVLAAGIGILYSEPHNGEMEKARTAESRQRCGRPALSAKPKLYLELWRPWKLQRGKPDPVPTFAELCFARRREGTDGG